MKKILKITVIILVIAFIAIQFYRPDRTNPQIVQAETLESSVQVPGDISLIMERSCNDCHTSQTRYPWYSNISPFSWFLANHIADGRRQLNFSIWNTYTDKKKSHRLDDICEQLEAKEMPLPSYLWIHRDAVLSDSDSKALCDWARQEKQRLPPVE
jgi:hypothetical protein